MCTQAPAAFAIGTARVKSSKLPVWISPACSATMMGPRASANAVARPSSEIRPRSSAPTVRGRPRPAICPAEIMDEWTRSPARKVIGGAPARPSRSTSQPAARSTELRAASRPDRFAVVAPVLNPTPDSAGSPSRSSSHSPASSSAATTPGVAWREPAFWSHAETSQSAASPAG